MADISFIGFGMTKVYRSKEWGQSSGVAIECLKQGYVLAKVLRGSR
jgi:hypothetical protein